MNNKNLYEKYWQKELSKTDHSMPPTWDKLSKSLFIKNFKAYIKEPILDVGAGDEQVARLILNKNLASQIYATDIVDVKEAVDERIIFAVNDIEKGLPYDNNFFNTIILTDVIEHLLDIQSVIKELNRVLKVGGKVLVVTPDYNLLKKLIISLFFWEKIFDPNSVHIRFFTKKTLAQSFEKQGFKNIKYVWGLTWFSIMPQNSYSVYEKTTNLTNFV